MITRYFKSTSKATNVFHNGKTLVETFVNAKFFEREVDEHNKIADSISMAKVYVGDCVFDRQVIGFTVSSDDGELISALVEDYIKKGFIEEIENPYEKSPERTYIVSFPVEKYSRPQVEMLSEKEILDILRQEDTDVYAYSVNDVVTYLNDQYYPSGSWCTVLRTSEKL